MSEKTLSNVESDMERTQVVIFAGGMGKRMGVNHPKALLHVGGKTLLDRCIDFYSNAGFTKFVFLLGHKHEEILMHLEEHDHDHISYSYSVDPRSGIGRAMSFRHALRTGALDLSQRAMIVYPDDLFTDRALPRRILSEHLGAAESLRTLGSMVLAKGLKWPYGVAEVEESGLVTQFTEKPVVQFPTSVGSYVLEPEVYELVSDHPPYETPLELEQTLIPQLSRAGRLYAIFIQSDSWLPINNQKDLEEAQKLLLRLQAQERGSRAEIVPSIPG